MSSRLPVDVNPFRMVEQRKSLTGSIPVERLSRLADMLTSDEGEVAVTLDFVVSETGLPMITGSLQAQLELICQRCLGPMKQDLNSSVKVVLVTTDAEAVRLQDGFDILLVEDEKLYLQDFIEDEILLALPLSAMHEDCDAARPYIEALPEDELNPVADEVEENPFAALKNLKGSE